MKVPSLESVLDDMVSKIQQDEPNVTEWEASFSAVRANLSAMTQVLTMIGMEKGELDTRMLYIMCENLIQTIQWMAAKELAAQTLREMGEEA